MSDEQTQSDRPYIELTITVTNLGPPRTSETRYYSNNPVTGRPWTLDDVNRIGVRVVQAHSGDSPA